MSGYNNDISNSSGPGSSAEPSMEEILASIRRILKEEEATPGQVDIDDDVLVLDHTMLAKPADYSSATTLPVDTGLVEAHPDAPVTSYHEAHFSSEPAFMTPDFYPDDVAEEPAPLPEEVLAVPEPPPPVYQPEAEPPAVYQSETTPEPEPTPEYEDHMSENVEPPHGLLSEEATGAAASSIGALIRSVSADRTVAVSRGGTTIEDIVREEIRPLLKAWLDTQLPSLVERVVRSEIERVVNRSAS